MNENDWAKKSNMAKPIVEPDRVTLHVCVFVFKSDELHPCFCRHWFGFSSFPFTAVSRIGRCNYSGRLEGMHNGVLGNV
jgi:hypothetical protein